MRISDWSSDVCSSDLWCTERIVDAVLADLDRLRLHAGVRAGTQHDRHCRQQLLGTAVVVRGRGGEADVVGDLELTAAEDRVTLLRGQQVVQRRKVEEEIGQASCRERRGKYV